MRLSGMLWGVLCLFLAGGAAAETGHYPHGAEGIKGASLPPPGLYLRHYNVFYQSDTLTDGHGREVDVDLDVEVFATVPRIIWMTPVEILGAHYGVDVAVPIVHSNFEVGAANVDAHNTRLSDILFEPVVLGWHTDRFDFAAAWGFWAPTGDPKDSNPGLGNKDFWSFMTTFGVTWYPDEEKTWAVSWLGRHEIHTDRGENDVTPGQDFHFEWAVSKCVAKGLDVGVVGYAQWQITDDEGDDAVNGDVHDRTFAVGPEVSYFLESATLNFSLRHECEFETEDRAEGQVTVLTLTKVF